MLKRTVSFLIILAMALAVIPAAGVFADGTEEVHNFVETGRVEPTCTEDGYIDYVCSGNGFELESSPVSVIGQSRLSADQLLAYSKAQVDKMRLTCTVEELIGYYISIGNRYNIRGDIAYLQAVKETGWFKFNRPGSYWVKEDGVWVKVNEPRPEGLYAVPEDNNFCGLGITGRLGDESRLCRFATAELGVTAHIQHLYAYAVTDALPEGETLTDPRFGLVTRGCATTWIALGEDHWTSSETYGTSIENSYFAAAANYVSEHTGCGETKREIIKTTGHDWSDWTVTSEATDIEDGSKERVCSKCGAIETEVIPAGGIPEGYGEWTEWVISVPATHTSAGEMTRLNTTTFDRETVKIPVLENEYGDADRDGIITVADALVILRAAAKLSVLKGEEWLLADIDKDRAITTNDALMALRISVRLAESEDNSYPSSNVVTLKNKRNETFRPVPDDSDKSLPQYYWLPEGTTDTCTAHSVCSSDTTLEYYTLGCGIRVYTKDSELSEKTLFPSRILGAKVENTGRFTDLKIAVTQKVPFRVRTVGLFPENNTEETVATSAEFTKFEIIVSNSALTGDCFFEATPLMSELDVSTEGNDVVYSFTLKRTGMFCGFSSFFDEDGNLVIHMHNPLNTSNGRLDGAVICLDAGHGGNDTGASGYINEGEENVKVLLALKARLEELGATVYYTRNEQYYYSDGTKITKDTQKQYRVDLISSFDPDILISIHHNDFSDPSANGTEALYFYGFNQALARRLSDWMAYVSGMRNRGGKYQNVFVFRNHDFMSVLLECGFVGNAGDAAWLSAEGNTEVLAFAIANGLIEYFM